MSEHIASSRVEHDQVKNAITSNDSLLKTDQSTYRSSKTITFLGIGKMGSALAIAHLKAGSRVRFWNRNMNSTSADILTRNGGVACSDLQEAIASSKILAICLIDQAVATGCLRDLVGDRTISETFPQLQIVVNFSAGTLDDTKDLASIIQLSDTEEEHHQLTHVEAALLLSPESIGKQGEPGMILYSGLLNKQRRDLVKDFMSPLAPAKYIGLSVLRARIFDAAILASSYNLFSGLSLALAILMKGVASESTTDSVTSQQTGRTFLKDYLRPVLTAAIAHADFLVDEMCVQEGSFPVNMVSASLRNVKLTCDGLGVDSSVLDGYMAMIEGVLKDEGSKAGMSRVVNRMQQKYKPLP